MSFSDVAPPPWVICSPEMAFGISEWLCENKLWPVVHTLFNFMIHLYVRDFPTCLLLAYIWESLEAIPEVLSNSSLIDSSIESLGGSLISDMVIALIGNGMAAIWLRVWDYRYRPLVPFWGSPGLIWTWVHYAIQFFGMAIPTFILYMFPTSINGIVPMTYLMLMVWVPFFYVLFSAFNENKTHWEKHKAYAGDGFMSTEYYPTAKIDKDRYSSFHRATGLFILVFLGTFIYRYTSVFIMALFHDSLFIILCAIYGIASGTFSRQNAAGLYMDKQRLS